MMDYAMDSRTSCELPFALAAVMALAFCLVVRADDAAGVIRASISNESVTVVMPFSPFPPGTPAYFLAGPFMGDGGAFSDMLHVAPADGSIDVGGVVTVDFAIKKIR